MENIIALLGGDDAEMQIIKNVLMDLKIPALHNTIGGKPVHGGNAYKVSEFDSLDETIPQDAFVLCIETRLPTDTVRPYKVIDHHNPGDPGFDFGPEKSFEGSSIGQLLNFLEWEKWGETVCPDLDVAEMAYVAAADHCLGAAYRGECPGIDPDSLLRYRIKQKAAFLKVSEEELFKTILSTIDKITQLSEGEIVDLSEQGTFPELPEAASYLGVAYVAKIKEPSGREKLVLGGNTNPALVEQWLSDQANLGREVYGNPKRGFAGAYLD